MSRDFTVNELIMLPRMKSRELLAIARALVQQARKAEGVEHSIRDAVRDIDEQRKALTEVLNAPEKKPPVRLKAADNAECNAVSTLVDFAALWVRLPESDFPAQVATARACVDVFREDGTLEFLKLKSVVKHSEVQRRLEVLEERGLDTQIRALGGGAFLDHLQRVHEVYGAAVVATTGAGGEESPAIRARSAELAEAVKSFVVRVVATVDRRRPETQARANLLLAPLRTWTSSQSAAASTKGAEPQPVPTHDIAQPAPANDAMSAPVRRVG